MRSKLHTVPRTPRQLFPEARRIIEIIEIIDIIDIIESLRYECSHICIKEESFII